MSWGTRTPRRARARRAPTAIWSLAKSIASGRSPPRSSRVSAAWAPSACFIIVVRRAGWSGTGRPASRHASWKPRNRASASGESVSPPTKASRRRPWSSIRWRASSRSPSALATTMWSRWSISRGPASITTGSRRDITSRSSVGTVCARTAKPSTRPATFATRLSGPPSSDAAISSAYPCRRAARSMPRMIWSE